MSVFHEVYSELKCWLDNKHVLYKSLPESIFTHGFHYGSSAFEGIRAYETKAIGITKFNIFKAREHFERLERSARFIGWDDYPYSVDYLIEQTEALIALNGLRSCYIRPVVFLNDHSLKIATSSDLFSLLILVRPWKNFFDHEKSIAVSLCPTHGPGYSWREVKLSAHYAYTLPFQLRARRQGFDDILRYGKDKNCIEFSGANLGYLVKDIVYLPTISEGLNGITKQTLIDICLNLGVSVQTDKKLALEELNQIDGLFSLGTATEICPISRVDQLQIQSSSQEVVKELMVAYGKLTSCQ